MSLVATGCTCEHEPVAMENSKSARARNRRVEIVVVIPQDAALSMAK